LSQAVRIAAFIGALVILAFSFINASWLAGAPSGRVRLVALKGAHQQAAPGSQGPCTAAAIESPLHEWLENTRGGIVAAGQLGAQMISADLDVTRDGHLVLFADEDLSCRTDGPQRFPGKSRIGDLTLAEVETLDPGHGYTADGGRTFPFRGRATGAIPPLEQVLALMPEKPMLFDLPADPRAGAQLVETLRAMGRDPVKLGDGFRGLKADLAPIARAWPKAWLWDRTAAATCTAAYRWQGWLGLTPAACTGGTIVIPANQAWTFAGWPDRLQARMKAAGAHVVATAPGGTGLTLPEQIGDIPASFTGHVMVEDIWAIGPALRPAYNHRNPLEEAELAKALEARRAAQ
jgi:glycerophosphoryl diester phosphodiesterase